MAVATQSSQTRTKAKSAKTEKPTPSAVSKPKKSGASSPTSVAIAHAFEKLPPQLAAVLPVGLDESAINQFWQHHMDDEMVSASITQTWTDQALKCYLTCADCHNCSIPMGRYSFDCQMNKVVPALLSTIGGPDLDKVEKLIPVLDRY